jgi:predicted nucleic acid-binding protein
MKLLIDCDVLLDVALEREPFVSASARLLDYLERHPNSAAIAWHSISNFYYIAAKAKNTKPARAFIADLCNFLYVVPTSNADVVTALGLSLEDFEDALQCAAALVFQAECIVTRNVVDYENAPIPALTPEQAIDRYLSA